MRAQVLLSCIAVMLVVLLWANLADATPWWKKVGGNIAREPKKFGGEIARESKKVI